MNVESWSGRGNKVLVTIPPVRHLKYDRFKQNCKSSNFVNQSLDVLSNNTEKKLSPSVINVCHYLADNFEDEFMSTANDVDLIFSSHMSSTWNVSMMSGVGLNISQLRILLPI